MTLGQFYVAQVSKDNVGYKERKSPFLKMTILFIEINRKIKAPSMWLWALKERIILMVLVLCSLILQPKPRWNTCRLLLLCFNIKFISVRLWNGHEVSFCVLYTDLMFNVQIVIKEKTSVNSFDISKLVKSRFFFGLLGLYAISHTRAFKILYSKQAKQLPSHSSFVSLVVCTFSVIHYQFVLHSLV